MLPAQLKGLTPPEGTEMQGKRLQHWHPSGPSGSQAQGREAKAGNVEQATDWWLWFSVRQLFHGNCLQTYFSPVMNTRQSDAADTSVRGEQLIFLASGHFGRCFRNQITSWDASKAAWPAGWGREFYPSTPLWWEPPWSTVSSQLWGPQHKQDRDLLEQVQRGTKMLRGLSTSAIEMGWVLGLVSLEKPTLGRPCCSLLVLKCAL